MQLTSIGCFPGRSPLYKEVKRKIAESIQQGEWKPGASLPAEAKLCKQFAVSIGTLRKAVDELVMEGVLIRQQGRGTFVSRHNKDRYLFSFFHIVRHDGYRELPHVELLSYKASIAANDDDSKSLGLAPGAALIQFCNLLTLEAEPVVIDHIRLPKDMFATLDETSLRARKGTLYQLYQEAFSITIVKTDERVRAIKADADMARQLHIAVGDPLLHVIRVALTFDDKPVELRHSYVSTRRFEYRADLSL